MNAMFFFCQTSQQQQIIKHESAKLTEGEIRFQVFCERLQDVYIIIIVIIIIIY